MSHANAKHCKNSTKDGQEVSMALLFDKQYTLLSKNNLWHIKYLSSLPSGHNTLRSCRYLRSLALAHKERMQAGPHSGPCP